MWVSHPPNPLSAFAQSRRLDGLIGYCSSSADSRSPERSWAFVVSRELEWRTSGALAVVRGCPLSVSTGQARYGTSESNGRTRMRIVGKCVPRATIPAVASRHTPPGQAWAVHTQIHFLRRTANTPAANRSHPVATRLRLGISLGGYVFAGARSG